MFWILRRTGAANFFNSLNNNCNTSKGNNNNTNDKYVKRPPRKAYGRLSADSDDGASMKQKIDDPFDDHDNFEMITPGRKSNGNSSKGQSTSISNGIVPHTDNGGGGVANGVGVGAGDAYNGNGIENSNCCPLSDCQGNFENSELCNLDESIFGGDSEINGVLNKQKQKEVNQNTINRLHAMAMSDDDDYDEALTCNVCDRAFACHRQLASHQQKKRHFCGCDSLFPSLMLLEHHKEEFEHWSDDEINRRMCCRRNRGDDYFTDTDSFTSEAESEDLERLL